MIPDSRDASRVTHPLPDILRARIFAIACGYEDADDLDHLRFDPAFKLACGRLPDTGRDLCLQPTISRLENAPSLRDLIRLMGVMVDLYCASYAKPPEAVTLDIDDTVDVVGKTARGANSMTWRRRIVFARSRRGTITGRNWRLWRPSAPREQNARFPALGNGPV